MLRIHYRIERIMSHSVVFIREIVFVLYFILLYELYRVLRRSVSSTFNMSFPFLSLARSLFIFACLLCVYVILFYAHCLIPYEKPTQTTKTTKHTVAYVWNFISSRIFLMIWFKLWFLKFTPLTLFGRGFFFLLLFFLFHAPSVFLFTFFVNVLSFGRKIEIDNKQLRHFLLLLLLLCYL